MTLQQRENTIYNIDWNSTNDATKGPIIALEKLEEATANWTNVNDQTYEMGTTVFADDGYTGCTVDYIHASLSCTANTYIFPKKTTRSRMITAQEYKNLYSSSLEDGNCYHVWRKNYLSQVQESCYSWLTNDDGPYGRNDCYWTMTTDLNSKILGVSTMNLDSYANTDYFHSYNCGARAVVVINK